MLHPKFPLETERLTYRPVEARDKDWLHALRNMLDVMRYVPMGGESYEAMDEVMAKRAILTCIDGPGDALMCLMEEKGTGARVGEVMLRYPSDSYLTGEIGYILHPDYHGHGYAFEGAQLMLRLGFEEAKFHRIMAITDGANGPSRALLKRLGLREEAHFRQASWFKGTWHDDVIAAMLAEEWHARSA